MVRQRAMHGELESSRPYARYHGRAGGKRCRLDIEVIGRGLSPAEGLPSVIGWTDGQVARKIGRGSLRDDRSYVEFVLGSELRFSSPFGRG